MTVSDAERVAMWPRVPYATCTVCGDRGPATWQGDGHLLCDPCLEAMSA